MASTDIVIRLLRQVNIKRVVTTILGVTTMTTALTPADLLRFFAATGHTPRWLDFPL